MLVNGTIHHLVSEASGRADSKLSPPVKIISSFDQMLVSVELKPAYKGKYHLYPTVSNIGLDAHVRLKFTTQDNTLFSQVLTCLLTYPHTNLFTNDAEGIGLAFLDLPSNILNLFLSSLRDLKLLYGKLHILRGHLR